jgi:hypothetical protein
MACCGVSGQLAAAFGLSSPQRRYNGTGKTVYNRGVIGEHRNRETFCIDEFQISKAVGGLKTINCTKSRKQIYCNVIGKQGNTTYEPSTYLYTKNENA